MAPEDAGDRAVGSRCAATTLRIGHADVVIAAVNGSESVTVAGPVEAINTLHADLESSGVFTRRLKVTVPYHSALMDPILDDLASALAVVQPAVPARPLYSTVTGAQVTGAEWDAAYWCANVRQPVRFADAIDTLITEATGSSSRWDRTRWCRATFGKCWRTRLNSVLPCPPSAAARAITTTWSAPSAICTGRLPRQCHAGEPPHRNACRPAGLSLAARQALPPSPARKPATHRRIR